VNDDDAGLLHESLGRALTATADPRAAVVDFGWPDLLAEDPRTAVSTLFTLCGSRLVAGSFLDDVLLAQAGIADADRVVLPPPGAAEPASRYRRDEVVVQGIVQAGDGPVLVPARGADGDVVLVRVTLSAGRPREGVLDPDAGWALVDDLTCPVDEICPVEWPELVAAGRRALAVELVAIGSSMLATAVEHVATRRQFGRPLGAFQAVQQPLADVRLWQETAGLAADAAWEDGTGAAAALAKLLAVRFTAAARLHCQQVLGGMGFTWEFPFHRHVRRALVLEPLLGDAATLRAELGASVRTGGVPGDLARL
jgi:hypothetical protein